MIGEFLDTHKPIYGQNYIQIPDYLFVGLHGLYSCFLLNPSIYLLTEIKHKMLDFLNIISLDLSVKSQILSENYIHFDTIDFAHREEHGHKMEVDQLIPADSWPLVSCLLKAGPTFCKRLIQFGHII